MRAEPAPMVTWSILGRDDSWLSRRAEHVGFYLLIVCQSPEQASRWPVVAQGAFIAVLTGLYGSHRRWAARHSLSGSTLGATWCSRA